MDSVASSNVSMLTTTSYASGKTSGTASVASFDDAEFVVHVNYLLAAIFCCFFVYRLPRGAARLTRLSEWTRGFILYSTSRRSEPTPRPTSSLHPGRSSPSAGSISQTSFQSMWTHRSVAHTKESSGRTSTSVAHYPHSLHTVGENKRRFKLYPRHVPSFPPFLRSTASFLSQRMTTAFSWAQLILLTLYWGIMLYAALYKSNPLSNPARTGLLAMSQVPVVFALSAKNGIVGWLIGIGYEKLTILHREAGKIVGLYVNIHALGYFYEWSVAGTLTASLKKPSNAWGVVGLVCVDVLYLLSTPFWRQKAYNVFLTSHIVSLAILLPAMVLHKPAMTLYVFTAAGIFAFDHLMRVIKSRYSYARLRPMPEMGGTLVEIPGINAGWRAGQFVRLRVLTTELGWLGWAESHPLTVAAVSGAEEGMVFLVRKAGDWSDKLYEMAKRGGYSEDGLGGVRIVPVIVEGPYGGPGHQVFTSYSAAVFVVGGSGISYAIAAILEIVQQDIKGASRVKHIELIWFVQDYASVGPMLPLFTSLIAQSEPTPLRITVNYTRASRKPIEKTTTLPGITISPIKPKIGKILEATVERTTSFGSGMKDSDTLNGIIIGVCGPSGLGDQVATAVRNVEPKKRDAVGGIELYEESFDW